MSGVLRVTLALTLPALALGSPPAAPAQEVSLRTVKYDELTKLVRSLQGKVVVVDFWNHT
jgi:hypothetical protein